MAPDENRAITFRPQKGARSLHFSAFPFGCAPNRVADRSASTGGLADEFDDPLWRDWRLGDANAERLQRILDR